MCGRYNFSVEESAELREIVQQIEANNARADWHAGEIFPTNTAPVLLWEQEHAEPNLLGWGFPGFKSGAHTIINARAETAAERPMFRKSLDGRRCVVPTSGFFEWQKPSKQKYLFRLPDADATYLASASSQRRPTNPLPTSTIGCRWCCHMGKWTPGSPIAARPRQFCTPSRLC